MTKPDEMPWDRVTRVIHNVPSKRRSYAPIPSHEVFMNQQNGVWIPQDEARALWEGARMMMEIDSRLLPPRYFGPKDILEFKEAIALLKKGIGE